MKKNATPKKSSIKFERTNRGFALSHFIDKYGQDCSLQESSIFADKDGACIWFGVNNTKGKFHVMPTLISKEKREALGLHFGWNVKSLSTMFPDCDVNTPDRMHLSQKMVKQLLPALQYFAKHGRLPVDKK